ncbi:fungal-specific transcription factor domain-containing protein [Penicillium lagena]|uniref:fungal-specific transcription factor domain-containing protein n=1 Tax=Penicillium lagena TaxID=94218 RepID=UPI00253FF047|nr:fungal-specific transcription factor domain-containing protein [Penicillium lagena]KAJ5604778.1 fungal-specific transcription factor domain-containing protein [Penicillium lagena]
MDREQDNASDKQASTSETSRSCVRCYRRKTRCDRKSPCSQCARMREICTYPSERRDSGKKSSSLQDISDRLQRIESVLLWQMNREPSSGAPPPTSQAKISDSTASPASYFSKSSPTNPSRSWEILLKDGERVHYVDNANLLDVFQDEERMKPPDYQFDSGKATRTSRDLNLITGISPIADNRSGNPADLYPDPQLALRLWRAFIENVDPVVKVLHIPTTQSSIITLVADPSQTTSSFSALAFAIYFAATTSLSEDEISEISSNSRSELLEKFKNGLNQIIIDLNLFNEPDVTTVEAIAIFAASQKTHSARFGTAIRLAQSIGIHRDGAALGLSPFETERRLRLWWHLNLLDHRAPEDHGFAYSFDWLHQGQRLPLNVDDDCLFPTMETLPSESDAWTQTSFALAQIEATKILQRVLGTIATGQGADLTGDLEERKRIMREHKAWFEKKFFSHKALSQAQETAAAHYKTAYTKMEFMLQAREHLTSQADHKNCSTSSPSKGLCEIAFSTACRTIESSYSLLSGRTTGNLAWLFQVYPQWYALAYVLRFLCAFPLAPETEKAWDLVNKMFDALSYSDDLSAVGAGRGSIWRCLARIRHQVWIARGGYRRSASGTHRKVNKGVSQSTNVGESSYATHNGPQEEMDLEYMQRDENMLEPEWPSQSMPPSDPAWDIEGDLFGDSMPDMLCLPEWNDIVNGRRLGST